MTRFIRRTPERDDNSRMMYLHVHTGNAPGVCLYVAERHENTARHGDFFLSSDILCAAAFRNGDDPALEAIAYLQQRINELGGCVITPQPVHSLPCLNDHQRKLLNL